MRISGCVLDPHYFFYCMRTYPKIIVIILATLLGCDKDEDSSGLLEVVQAFAGTTQIALDGPVTENVPTDRSLTVVFSAALDQNTAASAIALKNDDGDAAAIDVSFTSEGKAAVIRPVAGSHDRVVSPDHSRSVIDRATAGTVGGCPYRDAMTTAAFWLSSFHPCATGN